MLFWGTFLSYPAGGKWSGQWGGRSWLLPSTHRLECQVIRFILGWVDG